MLLRGQPARLLRSVVADALYRGSLVMLLNTAVMSALGVAFWALAARSYPAAAVGSYSAVVAGVGLLSAVAALGLPTLVTRHIAGTANPRELLVATVIAITVIGGTVCLLCIAAFGPHLPSALHLRQHGRMVYLITALVVITAVSAAIDNGLIALRASQAVLLTNLAGSIVKVAALCLLPGLRSSGLLIAYSLGLIVATVTSGVALIRLVKNSTGQGQGRSRGHSLGVLRSRLSGLGATYLATVMGILPITVVPLEVLAIRGAAETARFTVAFLIAGFLNFIPSATAQVLFAEASRRGAAAGQQVRKAARAVYGLLLPAIVALVVAAPLALRLFGAEYASQATGCLRVLVLSATFTGGTYLIDAMLISRDRTGAYLFMNGANAALVVGATGLLLPHGLTAGAWGWTIGQGLSLLLGLAVVATGRLHRAGHPRRVADRALAA